MAVDMTAFPPSIEVATLYEATSARGLRYMRGRLGAARIVLLPGEPTEDGTATWKLLLQERRENTAPVANDRPEPAPPPQSQRPRAPRRRPKPRRDLEAAAADRPAALDDQISDLWQGGER